jgi:hypothetical protein
MQVECKVWTQSGSEPCFEILKKVLDCFIQLVKYPLEIKVNVKILLSSYSSQR